MRTGTPGRPRKKFHLQSTAPAPDKPQDKRQTSDSDDDEFFGFDDPVASIAAEINFDESGQVNGWRRHTQSSGVSYKPIPGVLPADLETARQLDVASSSRTKSVPMVTWNDEKLEWLPKDTLRDQG